MTSETATEEKLFTGPFIPERLLVDWAETPISPDKPLDFDDLRNSGIPGNIKDAIGDLYAAINFSMCNDEMPECEFEFVQTEQGHMELEHRGAVQVLKVDPDFLHSAAMADLIGEIVLSMCLLNAIVYFPMGYADELRGKDTPSRAEFRKCRDDVPRILGIERKRLGGLFPIHRTPLSVPVPCEHIAGDLFHPSPHPDRKNEELCKLNCAELIYAGKNYFEAANDFEQSIIDDFDTLSADEPELAVELPSVEEISAALKQPILDRYASIGTEPLPEYLMGPFVPKELLIPWSSDPYNSDRPVSGLHKGVPRNMPHRVEDILAILNFVFFDSKPQEFDIEIVKRDDYNTNLAINGDTAIAQIPDHLFSFGTPFAVVVTLHRLMTQLFAVRMHFRAGLSSDHPRFESSVARDAEGMQRIAGSDQWDQEKGKPVVGMKVTPLLRVAANIMGDEQFDLTADRETCRAGCELMLKTFRLKRAKAEKRQV